MLNDVSKKEEKKWSEMKNRKRKWKGKKWENMKETIQGLKDKEKGKNEWKIIKKLNHFNLNKFIKKTKEERRKNQEERGKK